MWTKFDSQWDQKKPNEFEFHVRLAEASDLCVQIVIDGYINSFELLMDIAVPISLVNPITTFILGFQWANENKILRGCGAIG